MFRKNSKPSKYEESLNLLACIKQERDAIKSHICWLIEQEPTRREGHYEDLHKHSREFKSAL